VGFAPYRPYPFFRRLAPWLSLGCRTAKIAVTLDTPTRIPQSPFRSNSTKVLPLRGGFGRRKDRIEQADQSKNPEGHERNSAVVNDRMPCAKLFQEVPEIVNVRTHSGFPLHCDSGKSEILNPTFAVTTNPQVVQWQVYAPSRFHSDGLWPSKIICRSTLARNLSLAVMSPTAFDLR
jgi:hypothetical protein